jgi:hypothetical protein
MARANKTPFNAAAGASIPQSAASRDAAEDDANSGSTIANDLAPPGVPPPFQSLASGKLSGQPPCTNLGLAGDKIRIYLWSEKDTPPAITAAYANHLQAVVDVRIVSKAPYDLVVYVNGAIAGALDSRPGFIWSSRVFRPWYCGQTLGFLEQTQVNESLHYVESSNLDRHIQSEVAYMILHSFEAVRNEHVK